MSHGTDGLLVTPYALAARFLGLKEVPGKVANPQILAMLQLDAEWPPDDEVPWCSAFVNYIAWLLRLERSKSLRARSWLEVGRPVPAVGMNRGWDVVILNRGPGVQPGADVIDAPGHVGFYSGSADGQIYLLGGNQGNAVSVAGYRYNRILGVRSLKPS